MLILLIIIPCFRPKICRRNCTPVGAVQDWEWGQMVGNEGVEIKVIKI